MDFTPATQNGVQPPTDYRTKDSKFRVLVNTTSSYYGGIVVAKAISDAALYKENPVTFYSEWSVDGIVQAIQTLGTATWASTTTAGITITTLQTGTNKIYATWPGQGRFAPQTTEALKIPVQTAPGLPFPGTLTLGGDPPLGVTTEPVTFTVTATTSLNMVGQTVILIEDNNIVGAMKFDNTNHASTTTVFDTTGTYQIEAVFPGGDINGTIYSGIISNVLDYSVPYIPFPAPLTLTVDPLYNSVNSSTTFTANFATTAATATGIVSFKKNNSVFHTATLVNNVATFVANSGTFVAGTYTIVAFWPGNGIYGSNPSNSQTITEVNPSTTNISTTYSTSTFQLYTPSGAFNTTYPYVDVSLTTARSGNPTPTGSVSLINYDTGAVLAIQQLTGATSYRLVWNPYEFSEYGTINLAVKYSGDSWNYSAQSSSHAITVTKNIISLSIQTDPAGSVTRFSTVTISARVGTSYVLNQPITFYEGSTALGTSTFVNSIATLSYVPTVGTKTIRAVYPGDTTHEATSSTVSLTVNRYPNTVSLVSNDNPNLAGDPITFTVQQTSERISTNTLQMIAFTSNPSHSYNLGNVTLTNGTGLFTATFSTATTYNVNVMADQTADYQAIDQQVNELVLIKQSDTIRFDLLGSYEGNIGNGAYTFPTHILNRGDSPTIVQSITGTNAVYGGLGTYLYYSAETNQQVSDLTTYFANKGTAGPWGIYAKYMGDRFNLASANSSAVNLTLDNPLIVNGIRVSKLTSPTLGTGTYQPYLNAATIPYDSTITLIAQTLTVSPGNTWMTRLNQHGAGTNNTYIPFHMGTKIYSDAYAQNMDNAAAVCDYQTNIWTMPAVGNNDWNQTDWYAGAEYNHYTYSNSNAGVFQAPTTGATSGTISMNLLGAVYTTSTNLASTPWIKNNSISVNVTVYKQIVLPGSTSGKTWIPVTSMTTGTRHVVSSGHSITVNWTDNGTGKVFWGSGAPPTANINFLNPAYPDALPYLNGTLQNFANTGLYMAMIDPLTDSNAALANFNGNNSLITVVYSNPKITFN
jgi:hypothetical protein